MFWHQVNQQLLEAVIDRVASRAYAAIVIINDVNRVIYSAMSPCADVFRLF